MKTRMILAAFLALATGTLCAQNKVKVTVGNIENPQGHIMLAMFDKEGFLRTPVKVASFPANAESVTFTLDSIPSGEYAIALYHNENGNEAPDMSKGIPSGGYGLSNNPKLQGPPTFDLCKFDVTADADTQVKIDVVKINIPKRQ